MPKNESISEAEKAIYLHRLYMNPAQGDEVVLILHSKEFLFVLSSTRIRIALLLRNEQVGDVKFVLSLRIEIFSLIPFRFENYVL